MPPVVFVYSTCVVGIIGDDLDAVCKAAAEKYGVPVLPVQSCGFVGTKSIGYQTVCDVLFKLIEPPTTKLLLRRRPVINYLGDFNLAGEAWIIRSYLQKIGIDVNAVFTGDSRYEEIRRAANAELNIIQCAGSMFYLAQKLEQKPDSLPKIARSYYPENRRSDCSRAASCRCSFLGWSERKTTKYSDGTITSKDCPVH